MVKAYCPFLSRVLKSRFTALTFSLLVGFGVGACSDDEPTQEPVQTEAANGDADQAAVAELEGQAPTEGTVAAETTESKTVDDATVPPVEKSATDETAATDGEAPPLPSEQDSDAMLADAQQNGSDKMTETDTETTEATPPTEDNTAEAVTETAPTALETPVKMPATPSSTGNYSTGGNAYTVVKGDTLGQISEKIYGSAHLWNVIATNNNISAPYTIVPGQTIKYDVTNGQSKSFASNGASGGGGSGHTVTVVKGDTLSGIAHRVYGNASKWPKIFAHNKDKITDPNTIEVGMVLFCAEAGGTENADENDAAPVTKKSAHTHKGTGHKTVKTNWHKKKVTGH